MSNVASRTYKKKAWNELVGPALQRPAKSQKGASKATLRNGETAWCRGFTCTNFRPPFGGLRGQAAMSNVASKTYKKKAWNELVGPALQRPAKSQKGASKATLRNGETAWCRGFTCTNFRPPFGGLRGQTLRPEPRKKRLGMSLSAQHYQDQHRGRKGRQKPPSETATQHGVAGSRAPIFGLRLECCDFKRRVQNLQKKGLE